MAGNNIIQINNSKGNLLMRNDLIPLNCVDEGFFPKSVGRANSNLPPPNGWGMKHSPDFGKDADEAFIAEVSLDAYPNAMVAFRPDDISQLCDLKIVFSGGKKIAKLWTGYEEEWIQYYLFAPQGQPKEDFGLQLYHPDTGQLTFDSTWDVALPVKTMRIPVNGTKVEHGLGYKPAILPLSTAFGWRAEAVTKKNDGYWFVHYGVACDETHVVGGWPANPNLTKRFNPFYKDYIDVLLLNVNHI